MKRIVVLAGAILLAVPLLARAEQNAANKQFREGQRTERQQHMKTQHDENRQLRESLKGKTPVEKKAAVEQNRETQYGENKAFNQKQHDENRAYLKQRLAGNSRLTEAQKNELIGFCEQQYGENVSFRDQQHKENMDFFVSIANSPDMTMEQKKAAIKAHREQQKSENRGHHSTQVTERKAEHQKIKGEVKPVAPVKK